MKRLILIFAFYGIISGCSQHSEIKPFDKFKNQIPRVKLPYKIACYDTAIRLKITFPDSIFKKYAPAGATGIVGMIVDSEMYSAILYVVSGDRQYPVLQTYDSHGKKLNDIGLINGACCGNQTNCIGFSWGEITPDLYLVSVDSERVFVMGKDGNPLRLGAKLLDTTEVYSITKDGYIRLISNPSVLANHKVNRFGKGVKNVVMKAAPSIKAASEDSSANNTKNFDDSTKIIYKVQIVSSPDILPPTDSRFNTLKDVEMYKDKNMYHYTVGHFITKDEALVMQIKLRGTGFKEAFVVAFKGKKRM